MAIIGQNNHLTHMRVTYDVYVIVHKNDSLKIDRTQVYRAVSLYWRADGKQHRMSPPTRVTKQRHRGAPPGCATGEAPPGGATRTSSNRHRTVMGIKNKHK